MRSFQFDSGNYIEVEYMWELHQQVHLCERNLKTSQTLISTSGPQLRASVKRCIFQIVYPMLENSTARTTILLTLHR